MNQSCCAHAKQVDLLSVHYHFLALKNCLPPFPPSLGTRPLKNRKGGSGKLAGVEEYTAPGMQAHFQLAFD